MFPTTQCFSSLIRLKPCTILRYWVSDVDASQIHVLTEAADGHYRKTEVAHSPAPLAPLCLPTAVLDTKDLFQVV